MTIMIVTVTVTMTTTTFILVILPNYDILFLGGILGELYLVDSTFGIPGVFIGPPCCLLCRLPILSGSGPVSSAAELCQRMLDFCQRLTTAKRKILEDPELYPAAGEEQDMQVCLLYRLKPRAAGSNVFML